MSKRIAPEGESEPKRIRGEDFKITMPRCAVDKACNQAREKKQKDDAEFARFCALAWDPSREECITATVHDDGRFDLKYSHQFDWDSLDDLESAFVRRLSSKFHAPWKVKISHVQSEGGTKRVSICAEGPASAMPTTSK